MAINLETAHRVIVKISYGNLQPTLDLCEKICEGEYQYSFNSAPAAASFKDATFWEFFFESEKDYVAFLLWNNQ
jgi:hypothetical protein